jgi:FkbM family methyltransferase
MRSAYRRISEAINKYTEKLCREGIATILARRYRWYRSWLMIHNTTVGKLVELTGNRVWIDGFKFSVDCPEVSRAHKSTLWFGLHEIEERALLHRHLPAGFPVVELGGGLGVISCLTNRKLACPAEHIVVEASPAMAKLLERNRDLNHCQFRVVNAALQYGSPTVTFVIRDTFVGSQVNGKSGTRVTVPSTTLGQIVDTSGFGRFSLICDIEGTEADLVDHELSLIAGRAAFILAEIHPAILGQRRADQVVENLMGAGFALAERVGQNWAFVGPSLH